MYIRVSVNLCLLSVCLLQHTIGPFISQSVPSALCRRKSVCVCVFVFWYVVLWYMCRCVLCVCVVLSSSILQWNVVQSALLLLCQIVHGAWVGEGGDVVHSGQHAHACSTELPAAQCRASQPVSQLDNYRIHSHDSISESYLQLA